MKTYDVDLEVYVTVALDQRVIDVVDDEWRSMFYDLRTPQEIAEHIAYNMARHGSRLSHLDGFANLPDDWAKLTEVEWDIDQ